MSLLQGLQRNYGKFKELNTEILAVSVDNVEDNKKVKEKYALSFEILSDPKMTAISAYGLVHKDPAGVGHPIARPGEFLINTEGIIFQRWLSDSTTQRTHPETMIAELQRMEGQGFENVSFNLPPKSNAIGARRSAPDFTLADTTGKMRTLSEIYSKQNVVLVFFRGYWSSPCTGFLSALQSNLKSFEKLNTTILAITTDSVESNLELKKSLKLSFEILSDPNLKATRAYGMAQEDLKELKRSIARPGEYLMDQKGWIFQGYLPDRADRRTEVEAMLEDVKKMSEQPKK